MTLLMFYNFIIALVLIKKENSHFSQVSSGNRVTHN